MDLFTLTAEIPADRPVLIAGPTASGKSELALHIAENAGGVIINADALQVYANWRVLTARPDAQETQRAAHHLYGHVAWDAPYSVGHWLRDVAPLLSGARPIIVGGTGLYFRALTEGLADIPPTPPDIRATADALTHDQLMSGLDAQTAKRIDLKNRARVQRAWEVQTATGRGLADWQADTPPALLPLDACTALTLDTPVDWLNDRIAKRFDHMLNTGALDEVAANLSRWTPDLLSMRAIGAPELIAYLRGEADLDAARTRAIIASRQYANRQRTWFRARMQRWIHVSPN